MIEINEGIPTRQVCGRALVKLGESNKKLVVLEADISKSTYSYLFKEKFPERYFNMGIAEQNMMAVAAGLARGGYKPVVMTYAVFASMRACEQFRTSICYPVLDVKIFACHGGITPGTDGVTHQATEDFGMMRSIPGLKIIMPCDKISTEIAVEQALDTAGPVYMRLTRCSMPNIYHRIPKFSIGKGNVLRQGTDVTIIANGDMVVQAMNAAKLMEGKISASVIDMHTIKPIDSKLILDSAKRTGAIVTAEDHNIIGGLGSAVCEVLSGALPTPVERIGLLDTFAESGEYASLLVKYHMSAADIVKAVKKVIERKVNKIGH